MKRSFALLAIALAMVPWMGTAAHAHTNVTEKIECMFRVYVTEGGESGLDCLT